MEKRGIREGIAHLGSQKDAAPSWPVVPLFLGAALVTIWPFFDCNNHAGQTEAGGFGVPELPGTVYSKKMINLGSTCAVKRRWSTAGESPARELGSLHPEAIGAAVEETKPSEPPV
jgi:hypothetical protein